MIENVKTGIGFKNLILNMDKYKGFIFLCGYVPRIFKDLFHYHVITVDQYQKEKYKNQINWLKKEGLIMEFCSTPLGSYYSFSGEIYKRFNRG